VFFEVVLHENMNIWFRVKWSIIFKHIFSCEIIAKIGLEFPNWGNVPFNYFEKLHADLEFLDFIF